MLWIVNTNSFSAYKVIFEGMVLNLKIWSY